MHPLVRAARFSLAVPGAGKQFLREAPAIRPTQKIKLKADG
jgi:hypothetical protein